jgi:hypothetical protein
MELFYYIKRLITIPAIERKLLAKAFFLSAAVKILVQFLPLKYYLFMLKARPKYLLPESGKPQAIRLARKTMRRVVRFAPWHCTCLVKSITMKNLLNGLGVETKICLNIIKSNYQLCKAHAYIKIYSANEYKKENENLVFII